MTYLQISVANGDELRIKRLLRDIASRPRLSVFPCLFPRTGRSHGLLLSRPRQPRKNCVPTRATLVHAGIRPRWCPVFRWSTSARGGVDLAARLPKDPMPRVTSAPNLSLSHGQVRGKLLSAISTFPQWSTKEKVAKRKLRRRLGGSANTSSQDPTYKAAGAPLSQLPQIPLARATDLTFDGRASRSHCSEWSLELTRVFRVRRAAVFERLPTNAG